MNFISDIFILNRFIYRFAQNKIITYTSNQWLLIILVSWPTFK